VYFIKKVTIADKQDREQLAQTQKKKAKRKHETRAINGYHKLATWKESKRSTTRPSQLLKASNVTGSSLHILVPGRQEENVCHIGATMRNTSNIAKTGGNATA
jgi:hypothetical protein